MLDSSTVFSEAFSPVHEPLNVQIVMTEKYQSNITKRPGNRCNKIYQCNSTHSCLKNKIVAISAVQLDFYLVRNKIRGWGGSKILY